MEVLVGGARRRAWPTSRGPPGVRPRTGLADGLRVPAWVLVRVGHSRLARVPLSAGSGRLGAAPASRRGAAALAAPPCSSGERGLRGRRLAAEPRGSPARSLAVTAARGHFAGAPPHAPPGPRFRPTASCRTSSSTVRSSPWASRAASLRGASSGSTIPRPCAGSDGLLVGGPVQRPREDRRHAFPLPPVADEREGGVRSEERVAPAR